MKTKKKFKNKKVKYPWCYQFECVGHTDYHNVAAYCTLHYINTMIKMWSIDERMLLCPLHYKCRIGPSVDMTKEKAVSGNWRCNDLLFLVAKVCFYFFKFSVVYVEKKVKTKTIQNGCLTAWLSAGATTTPSFTCSRMKLTVSQPCIYLSVKEISFIYCTLIR